MQGNFIYLGILLFFILNACSPGPSSKSSAIFVSESFHPAVEVKKQPFMATNPMRGPGLHINGMRLQGDLGPMLLMVSSFDDGHEIVLTFNQPVNGSRNGLSECFDSSNPGDIKISLKDAGDLSANFDQAAPNQWFTSFDINTYSKLKTLDLSLCGAHYPLPNEYQNRLMTHIRLSLDQAQTADASLKATLNSSCEQGHSVACLRLAEMMVQGIGGTKEFQAGMDLYQRECKAGKAEGCLGASKGIRSQSLPTVGVEDHYRQAAIFARKACELKGKTEGLSCLEAATLHASGFGLPADANLVEQFATASCNRGFKYTCGLRSELVDCAKGQGRACASLAEKENLKRNRDPGKVALWNYAACQNGHALACETETK